MSWQNRVPEWANGPWISDEYYPWDTLSFPWLIDNNESADWTPRIQP